MLEQPTKNTPAPAVNHNSALLWEVLKVMIPTAFTTLFGLYIWNVQTDIKNKVDRNSQMLQTRLALSEEFYKRRLDVYQDACKRVASVKEALDQASLDDMKTEIEAVDRLAELDRFNKTNTLYMSDDLEQGLSDLWSSGIVLLRSQNTDDASVRAGLKDKILNLHLRMKDDLHVKEIGQIP
jgi:hypothetical protein